LKRVVTALGVEWREGSDGSDEDAEVAGLVVGEGELEKADRKLREEVAGAGAGAGAGETGIGPAGSLPTSPT
jgi:hypothetical protein